MKVVKEQYYNLRVTLESALLFPAVITIGSATAEDRSSEVACHLARAFADAGYRTIVVDASGGSAIQSEYGFKVAPISEFTSMATSASNGAIKNLSTVAVGGTSARTSTSSSKMHAAVTDLRLKFDVIVVNAGAIPADTAALQFASASDGVILAFRFGRKPVQADREVAATLDRVGAKVLGVVAIGTEAERRPEPAYRPQAVEQPAPQPVIAAAWPAHSSYGEVPAPSATRPPREVVTAGR